jgi:WD40 repeat protein
MLSATDALFSLHTSSVDAKTASNGSACSPAVTGVCFVHKRLSNDARDEDSDYLTDTESESSDEDVNDLQFKCSNLLLGSQSSHQDASRLSAASHTSLSGVVLVSCHQDGTCKLWDLATRRCIVSDAISGRNGPGLAVRRIGNHQFIYQSRDVLGAVSLHDVHRPSEPIVQIYTHSTTFCQVAPCCYTATNQYNATADGDLFKLDGSHLIALPTEDHSIAIIRDFRCDPTRNPLYRIDVGKSYGMLTSLALCHLQETTQHLVLGCGMEDGSALFYDLRANGSPWLIDKVDATECNADMSKDMCRVKLCKNPVLSLDLCSRFTEAKTSIVAVAGCAGDTDELSELPEQDQGTVSTIKVKLANERSDTTKTMNASIRTKTRTCSVESGGKVGVSVCRFRPDGRMFAVGGWDRRLRLFDRASSKPLAILHGHESSVTAVDWEGNAPTSGLLATGAGDGRICIYKV